MKRDYLSYSAIKAFAKSPNHYLRYVSREVAETPEMRFGTALHSYLLEPDTVADKYHVMPKIDKRTKEGKMLFAEQEELSKGKIVITEEDRDTILRMMVECEKHEPAAFFLSSEGEVEKPVEGERFDMHWKGFIDKLVGDTIIDVKTVQDSSPEAFARTAYQMGYHWQAALYRMLVPDMPNFAWIAIEKKEPYNVVVYKQSDDAFIRASNELKQLTEKFIDWDGSPGSYSKGVVNLDYPRWA